MHRIRRLLHLEKKRVVSPVPKDSTALGRWHSTALTDAVVLMLTAAYFLCQDVLRTHRYRLCWLSQMA